MFKAAAALAAITALLMPALPALADPEGADAAPVDDGRVVSNPAATLTATDGATLAISASEETQSVVAPLTTAISTREYLVGGVFRGSVTDSAVPPRGILEVGYQIGCGIDMGTGPGVLLAGNAGGNASLGVAVLGGIPVLIPNAGVQGGGSVTVALKPGIVLTVPVTKKQYQGEAPRVSIRSYRVRIDGCVGESFIRSYAILARSTDERETILSWYGATKAV
jgi:hypothetical protein